MKKARFLFIPCMFNEETNEMTPRYGAINNMLLSCAIGVWVCIGVIIPDCSGYFPIEVLED